MDRIQINLCMKSLCQPLASLDTLEATQGSLEILKPYFCLDMLQVTPTPPPVCSFLCILPSCSLESAPTRICPLLSERSCEEENIRWVTLHSEELKKQQRLRLKEWLYAAFTDTIGMRTRAKKVFSKTNISGKTIDSFHFLHSANTRNERTVKLNFILT